MRKLNFGCGSIQPEDWDNIDIDPSFNTQNKITADFTDNTFDIIVAHCSLQMTPYHELVNLLKDLRRILKSGGVLRISLPDILRGFRAYREGDISWFPNSESDINDRFSAWLTWYSTTKTLLTDRAMQNKLIEAGFERTSSAFFKQSWYLENRSEITDLDTREGECYFVEAKK